MPWLKTVGHADLTKPLSHFEVAHKARAECGKSGDKTGKKNG